MSTNLHLKDVSSAVPEHDPEVIFGQPKAFNPGWASSA